MSNPTLVFYLCMGLSFCLFFIASLIMCVGEEYAKKLPFYFYIVLFLIWPIALIYAIIHISVSGSDVYNESPFEKVDKIKKIIDDIYNKRH